MPVYSPTLIRALGAPTVAALACFGVCTEAHAALPTLLPSLDIGWSGLHIGDLLAGVAGSVRGCLTEVGLLGSFWGGVDPRWVPAPAAAVARCCSTSPSSRCS
jgi:hypothetical protein